MTNEIAGRTSPPPPDDGTREKVAMARLVDVLTDEFAATHTRDEVVAAIDRALAEFADAPVRTFVPTLVERKARLLLRTGD
jgi:hypothetical protein